MQRKKIDISARVHSFVHNVENTMNGMLCASVAKVLLRLENIYLKENSDDVDVEKYLADLSDHVKKKNNDSLNSAWTFIQRVMKKEPDEDLDYASVWENGVEIRHFLPLNKTIALVYAALTDQSLYENNSQQEQMERLSLLWECFESLKGKGVCPTGNRNDVTCILSGVYPGVMIVKDFEIFLHDIMMEYFHQHLEAFRITDPHTYLQILLFEIANGERHREFSKVLSASQHELKKMINKKCEEHGVNANDYPDVISSYMAGMGDLQLPVQSNKTLHCLKSLLMENENISDAKGEALSFVNTWIRQQFQIGNNEMEASLQSFSSIYFTLTVFKKFHAALQTWNHQRISPEEMATLETFFANYFYRVNEMRAPCLASDAELELLEKFQNSCLAFQRDECVDWIENIFFHWQEAQASREFKRLYARFSDPLLQQKYRVNDDFLRSLVSRTGKMDVSSYTINRIFLHAMTVPLEDWTPLFFDMLSEVHTFVVEDFKDHDNRFQADALKAGSYSEKLMKQLKYLQDYYQYLNAGKEEVNEPVPVEFVIPMPHFIKNFNHVKLAMKVLAKKNRLDFVKSLPRNTLDSAIPLPIDLMKMLGLLSNDDLPDALAYLGSERLIALIKNGEGLNTILENINGRFRLAFLNDLGYEVVNAVINTNDELQSFLKLFQRSEWLTERLSVIQKMGYEKIRPMVTTVDQLCALLELVENLQRRALIGFLEPKESPCIIKSVQELRKLIIKLVAGYDEMSKKLINNELEIMIDTFGDEKILALIHDQNDLVELRELFGDKYFGFLTRVALDNGPLIANEYSKFCKKRLRAMLTAGSLFAQSGIYTSNNHDEREVNQSGQLRK